MLVTEYIPIRFAAGYAFVAFAIQATRSFIRSIGRNRARDERIERSAEASFPSGQGGMGRQYFWSRMKSLTEYLWFEVPGRRGFVNITGTVAELVLRSGVNEGIVLCNAMHITGLFL